MSLAYQRFLRLRRSGNRRENAALRAFRRDPREVRRQSVRRHVPPRPLASRRREPTARYQHVPRVVRAGIDEHVRTGVGHVAESGALDGGELRIALHRDQFGRMRAHMQRGHAAVGECVGERLRRLVERVDLLRRHRLLHRLRQLRVDRGRKRPRTVERRGLRPMARQMRVVLAVLLEQQRTAIDHALHAGHAAGLQRGVSVDQHEHRRLRAEEDVGRIVADGKRGRRLRIHGGDRQRGFELVERDGERGLLFQLRAHQFQVLRLLRGGGGEARVRELDVA